MAGNGKLDRKVYKWAVQAELKRLLYQLAFLTFVSFMVALVLFISLVFDILYKQKENSEEDADVVDDVTATSPTDILVSMINQ